MKVPLNSEEQAALRHDLRTPLNHIIGYTEMLLENTAALGADDGDRLRRIYETGKRMVPIINLTLAGETASSEVDALRAQLRAPLAQIAEDCTKLLEHAAGESAGDLRKIRSAAAQLAAFVEQRQAPDGAPLAGAPVQAGGAEKSEMLEPAAGTGERGRLLVVDDNETNRDMLSRQLVRQGHDVSVAANGREALDSLRRAAFDLVLLDIMMPEVDGFQVLERMKSDPALREIPVIMISALDEVQSVVRCIEMGAEDYLAKPFDPVLLRARIGATLEKKKLRGQLLVQEKLASLGALTAGIAHELKNPLNFVTNFAELSADLLRDLRQELGGEALSKVQDILADLDQNIGKIQEHGKRADGIIRAMLMHSRARLGERQMTDINALVTENVGLAYHGLRAQDPSFTAKIEGEYDPAVGLASAVPQDLSRVLLNIANNALYAANEKRHTAGPPFAPTVWVRTRSLGPRIEIRIRDNGNGIPKAALGRIFTPFFTTKPAGRGTGLGLSISYDIVVREHQGEIRVESEEGSFAEFIVTLPKGQGAPGTQEGARK